MSQSVACNRTSGWNSGFVKLIWNRSFICNPLSLNSTLGKNMSTATIASYLTIVQLKLLITVTCSLLLAFSLLLNSIGKNFPMPLGYDRLSIGCSRLSIDMCWSGMSQAPQSELGIGENFGVGGAFAKWGAAIALAEFCEFLWDTWSIWSQFRPKSH